VRLELVWVSDPSKTNTKVGDYIAYWKDLMLGKGWLQIDEDDMSFIILGDL